MRKQRVADGQATLFGKEQPAPAPRPATADDKWRMPDVHGATVAEVRLRWAKRLTPAQVSRVEAELQSLPVRLKRLGFGAVSVERSFVRRRRA